MPRIALQLNETLMETVFGLLEVEVQNVFGDHPYMIVEMLTPTSFKSTLVSQDEIYELAASDPELQIIAF